ncbi:MAG: DNA mismatch repair endonuclease MutL [Endomicrobiales bacterium]
MTIRILSEETINKIAAGEVVERPANAVKELLENSLDAGSTRIELEVTGAGRTLLRVRDNGTGMTREEMALAVTRHATSKITDFSDVTCLHTLGFRGEALPSIAAVSRMRIQSQTPSGEGWEIKLSGGKIKESRAWAGAGGTTIQIGELFFNTPARAKFLKSDTTERHWILRAAEELALAWPSVAFKIVSEGKTVLNAPPSPALFERIVDVLGGELAKTLLPVEVQHPRLKVRACITRTEHSLSTRNCQYLFINQRPVSLGRLLTHSLYEAYRENLPAGRHPGAVIFLEIDPGEVDVNIHPAKREVRFANEREIHDLLLRALKETLAKTPFSPLSLSNGSPGDAPLPGAGAEAGYRVREGRSSFVPASMPPLEVFAPPGSRAPDQRGFPGAWENGTPLQPLAQVFGLYLVAQSADELLIIDQHAAAERVRYEKYLGQWQKKKVAVQPLLIPLTLELAASSAGLLAGNLALLREAGWELEEFGANTVRVTALPAVLGGHLETKNALAAVISALAEEAKLPAAERVETIIRAACRASIKAGDQVTGAEAAALLHDLFQCAAPFTCPHGRPTVFKLPRTELERYFGRK